MESLINTIPCAMFIQMAAQSLAQVDEATCNAVISELQHACPEDGRNFAYVKGYMLGLATALTLKMFTHEGINASAETHKTSEHE